MQITKEEAKGLAREFSITVPANDIEKHVEEELLTLGKKVKIPGFRPGKVPMKVLRQRYSKDVMGDVLERAVNSATRKVITDKELRPALQPDVKVVSFDEGQDLVFDINFEVMPEVPALDYDSITINEYSVEVSEDEVQETLVRLAKTKRQLSEKKGSAEKGDVVTIDFLGKLDGVPFPGGKGDGFELELGSGQFIPGFEDQLIGKKTGDEVLVEVIFPGEYHSEDLAGKPATFDVKIHRVSETKAADVNDALAKTMGFDDLQAIKEAIKKQIGADYERAARTKAKKELFDLLEEDVQFDVPEKMYAMEFDNIWQQVKEAKKSGDEELKNKSDEELKEEYSSIASRRVRLGILLSEVGRLNNLQISKEELSAAVMMQARQYPGQEEKVFEFFRKNPQQVDELKGPILEEKAVDFILSKVKRAEVKLSAEELFAEEKAEVKTAKAKKKPVSKKAEPEKADEKKSVAKKTPAKKKAS